MKRKNFIKFKHYYLNPVLPISNLALTTLVNKFWEDVASKFNSIDKFRIQAQFKEGDNVKSLCYIQILDNSDDSRKIFLNITLKYLSYRENQYNTLYVDNLYIRYLFVKNADITINDIPQNIVNITKIIDKNLDLPNSMNLLD